MLDCSRCRSARVRTPGGVRGAPGGVPRVKRRVADRPSAIVALAAIWIACAAFGPSCSEPGKAPHYTVEVGTTPRCAIYPTAVAYKVFLPSGYATSQRRYPVLYLLHGASEAKTGTLKGGEIYWDPRCRFLEILNHVAARRPVTQAALRDLASQELAREYQRRFEARPFRPFLIVSVCTDYKVARCEHYLLETVIPLIEKRYRTLPGRQNRALAGPCMGGAFATIIGFRHPARFGMVYALQMAVEPYEILLRQATKALQDRNVKTRPALSESRRVAKPAELEYHVVTSIGDVYQSQIEEWHKDLAASGFPHHFEILQGPHDYPFYGGPGGVSLLYWTSEFFREQDPERGPAAL